MILPSSISPRGSSLKAYKEARQTSQRSSGLLEDLGGDTYKLRVFPPYYRGWGMEQTMTMRFYYQA
jgi:hypothetical protein